MHRAELDRPSPHTTRVREQKNTLVRSVVAVPGHDIKRRPLLLGQKQVSLKLGHDLKLNVLVFKPAIDGESKRKRERESARTCNRHMSEKQVPVRYQEDTHGIAHLHTLHS
jgi:hypothetical protein